MTSSPQADLLFINGPVLTLDSERPEVDALAVAGGRITVLGTQTDVQPLAGPTTRVVDLEGRALVPGLADAHFHLVYFGMASSWLDLSSAVDAEQMTEAVRTMARAHPEGAWVYGRGWDPARLAGGHAPSLADLDAAAPRCPVLLSRSDGHVCLANTEALRRAGIGRETADPPGGRIQRDEAGEATGVLEEAALYLAWNAMMAELQPRDFREPLLRGCEAALRAGVTSVHAVLLENVAAELEALRALDARSELPLRVYALVPVDSLASLPLELVRWRGRRARVGGAKVFADGTLFAGTAALRSPYADAPASVGEMAYSSEELRALVQRARDAGLQPAIHAVGDRAIEEALDAFAQVYGDAAAAARPRIEHATVLAPDLVRRMRALGAVATLQQRRTAQLEGRLGPERASWANPWRALVDAGINVAASSDAPFLQASPGPWRAAVDGVQRGLTPEEALATLSGGPAYASFQEEELGALRPGMLADLTVLSRDPRGRPADQLREIRPAMSVVGGEVAWEAA